MDCRVSKLSVSMVVSASLSRLKQIGLRPKDERPGNDPPTDWPDYSLISKIGRLMSDGCRQKLEPWRI